MNLFAYLGPAAPDRIAGWISAVVTGSAPTGWFHADERGSINARTDQNGNVNAIQSYDEYGIPGSSNVTRFQYTGQMYLPAIGMHYYKARMYSPTLGRFMQNDPIGYDDGPNWYAYVKNDPVNFTDPLGLKVETITDPQSVKPNDPIYITAIRCHRACESARLDPMTEQRFADSLIGRTSASNESGDRGKAKTSPQKTNQPQPRCGNGWAAWIADKADKTSLYTGGFAATAGLAGLAAAPTGAGFAALEGAAAVSGLGSRLITTQAPNRLPSGLS